MLKLKRFGVSIDHNLLEKFDAHIKKKKYVNRSKAISDLMRKEFVIEEYEGNSIIAGAITIVFNHHKRDLLDKITDIQHASHGLIISSQHIHLDHDNCLEIIAVKGKYLKVKELADNLSSIKGVNHKSLCVSTTEKCL
jgi:CopG family transcriptional regulator, nickel-responsive regulator